MEEWRQDGQPGVDKAGVDFEGGVEHDGDEVQVMSDREREATATVRVMLIADVLFFFCADGQPYGWGMGNS